MIVDNLYNSSKECLNRIELISGKRPQFYNIDITDEAALEKIFAAHPEIDNVIHFAALKVCTDCYLLFIHISIDKINNMSLNRQSASLGRSRLNTTGSMLAALLRFCAP